MVYLSTSDEWQRQSALLLEARPSTTRITTKYKIPNLASPKYQSSRKRKREEAGDGGAEAKEEANAPKVPRAVLVLKTYDHESGACLKFKTDRAAEVGRLIGSLGRLGRHMAALPDKAQDVAMENTTLEVQGVDAKEAAAAPAVETKAQPQAGGGGGASKKKKKGKK